MDDRPSTAKELNLPRYVTFDAIMPDAMAARAEEAGARRASLDLLTLLLLSVLGGAFIGFGCIFGTTVSAGKIAIMSADGTVVSLAGLPYGIVRLLSGLAFSLGLILVNLAGAELFTSNNLIVLAWASGKVKTRAVLLNWAVVYVGNLAGAFTTAGLMFYTAQYTFGSGAVGLAALGTADAKSSLAFVPAIMLGIMCNALVCLAAWMCYGARTTVDRVVAIVPPVAAFVASGFEHCVANAYFIPLGLFIKHHAPQSFWDAIGKTAEDFPALTWGHFLVDNLVPVTLGNIIGGSVMVGAVYWFVYLRHRSGWHWRMIAGKAE